MILLTIFLPNKHPTSMQMDELVDEYLGQHEENPWESLFTIGYYQDHANTVEINPFKTLKLVLSFQHNKKINFSLS